MKLFIIGLLLLLVLSPFSGLAPLMFILLIAGVFWAGLTSSPDNKQRSQ